MNTIKVQKNGEAKRARNCKRKDEVDVEVEEKEDGGVQLRGILWMRKRGSIRRKPKAVETLA